MIYKRLKDIQAVDLQGLCERRVREDIQLDFKEAVPGVDDKGKIEFLRDVTALANTSGGDLVYGVTEEREADGTKTGIAATAPGVAKRPLFDSIWNAFGEERCLHYNHQDEWVGAELN